MNFKEQRKEMPVVLQDIPISLPILEILKAT
jgi:hypothetical protein